MFDINSLNPSQKEAVLTTEGPLMILAGAGSGKTRTIVSKINYLINEKSVSPHHILAVTFSNKAAKEMKDRVSRDTGIEYGALQITTFHAFCANVLRSEATFLGLSRNFTIYDDSESRAVIKSILSKRGISTKEISPFEIMYFISEIKNNGYYPERKNTKNYEPEKDDPFYGYYLEYQSELHRSNAVDFGDLIVGAIKLFESYPDVLDRYQKRFKYVLVDEYQDTNRAQFDLLFHLTEKNKNICVVGDEDQSIYSWRGADIRNIIDFEDEFTEAKIVKLEQNYRSSKIIIDAATCVISRNQVRKGKQMWTNNDDGEPITIMELSNDKLEANFICDEIKKIAQQGETLRDVAIFYRNNSQSRQIEDALRKSNVPYRVVAGIKFYDRKEIKDILSYIRLVVNSKDSLALSRIINVPTRGIGATTLKKLENEAIRIQGSLWEVIFGVINNSADFSHLKLSQKARSAIGNFEYLISEVMAMDEDYTPSSCVEKIIYQSGYMDYLQSQKDYESQARIENIEELVNGVRQYEESIAEPSLSGFLETITLDSSKDDVFEGQGEVSLMTVHGSKGLEFPYVFLSGAEENMFPSYKSMEMGEMALEEERRLFYVAMTRAMKNLVITFSTARMLFGSLKFNGPSRFLNEIPQKFCHWDRRNDDESSENLVDGIDYGSEYSQDSYVTSEATYIQATNKASKSKFKKGDHVIHSIYGEGSVINSEGSGHTEKVTIQFADGSKKKFMVDFAPIHHL